MLAVAPREGRVSRNAQETIAPAAEAVAPREGRVSRNELKTQSGTYTGCRAPRGACE